MIYQVPAGIDVKVDKQTLINLKGVDKRLVGQVAADLRAIKPPDVYKQKGVRYAGEILRKKKARQEVGTDDECGKQGSTT